MKNQKSNKLSNFSKLFIIFYVILFLLLYLLPFANYLKSFSTTNSLTTEYFVSYMDDVGCQSLNNISSEEKIDYIYKSDIKTCPYDITYMIVKDDEYREKLYNDYWDKVSINKQFVGFDREYTVSKGNDYRIVTRNDNSIFYLQTSLENEKIALKIAEDLKYNLDTGTSKTNQIISIIYSVVLTLFIIATLYTWWNLNKKLNRKTWYCLVPIYNILCLSKDILGKKIYCLLLVTPPTSYVFFMFLFYKLGKKFNKNTIFIICLIFMPIIFVPIIAFDNSKCLVSIKKQ